LLFVSVQCPISNGYNERMVNLAKTYERAGRPICRHLIPTKPKRLMASPHTPKSTVSIPRFKDTGNAIADRFEGGDT
jgi:hypothetical protein